MGRHYKKAEGGKAGAQRKVYTVLLAVCLCVFLFSVGVLIKELVIEPSRNSSVNNDIQDIFAQMQQGASQVEPLPTPTPAGTAEPEESPSPTPTPAPVDVRDGLRRSEAVRYLAENINEDIIGWITINGTIVDYPVLQSSREDPEYYLKRNYRHQSSAYGSIFMDAACAVDSDQQILYGHSMNDGSMFRSLIGFGNPAVTAASPVILYDTKDRSSQWLIVSVFKTNTQASQGPVFPYIRSGFSSAEEKAEYLYQLMQRSMVDTHVAVNETDDLLLLSTCSYEFSDFRTVVVARRLRDGEELPSPYVTAAANTRYPDCWYQKYGGTPFAWPETLQEARDQGLVSWYDR